MILSVRLPNELEKRLTSMSKKIKATNSQIAKDALATYLEDLEDYYDGMAVLKRIQEGKEEITSADEVFRKIGL